MSYVFTTAVALGVTFIFADWWEFGFYSWLGFSAAFVVALGLLAVSTSPQQAALLMVVTWAGLVVGQVTAGQTGDLAETVLLPFGLTTAATWVLRGRRLTTVARSAPLLLPVTLIVLVAPLLSKDLWEAADALGSWEIAAIALLTIVPLLIVFLRQLRGEVPVALESAVSKVAQDKDTQSRAVARAVRLVDEQHRDAKRKAVEGDLRGFFDAGFSAGTQNAVTESLSKPLRRSVMRRAVTTVGGLALAVSGYLFLLTWALVGVGVAERWLDRPIPVEEIALPGTTFDLPTGPYLVVAALLGVIATAVLLAYVVTEERYGRELSGALLKDPLEEGLSVALPYQALRERDPIPN